MHVANEDTPSPQKTDMSKSESANAMDTQSSSTRRALADMSPNVKVASPTPAFLKKAMAGSPLKRSFTAAIEGGEGFTYLKRRRLGEHEVLSEVAEGSFSPTLEQLAKQSPVWYSRAIEIESVSLTARLDRDTYS